MFFKQTQSWVKMASIKPIEGGSVHRIQSGQVIVDLCSVVKELVENSLDAGATSIDVRFKSYGLDLIEVQDNGSGIAKDDYDSIALKHYTSKLSTYEDITSLKTFGFRGEALSSLCALSNIHIITAREDEVPKGTRLDFENSGKLKGTQVVASQRGTTVSIAAIFNNLPVRRQELEKNVKREYGKVIALLQAYACISVNVKISVSNLMAKGKKAIVFATKSNRTTRENVANIFGAKTLSALIPLDLEFELNSSAGAPTIHEDESGKQVHVTGHVSRPIIGEGRQTPDRQMFFVNARPCGLPQVAKVFNEVYKTYNLSQSPFILANVILDTNAYDVNVSPDKRTVMLHDQGVLLESVKTSLIDLFERQQQTVPQTQILAQKHSLFKPQITSRSSPQSAAPMVVEESSLLDEGATLIHAGSDLRRSDELEHDPAESLIHQFLARKTGNRSLEIPPERRKERNSHTVSPDKQSLTRKLPERNADSDEADGYEDAGEIAPYEAYQRGIDVPQFDFNKRMAEQQAIAGQPTKTMPKHSTEVEGPLPSLASSPAKQSPGAVLNAYDRMRPTRTSLQTAVITVGSKTTLTTIGNLPATGYSDRKHKTDEVLQSSPATKRFGTSLRGFAAPGTQLIDSPFAEDDDEDNGTSVVSFSDEVSERVVGGASNDCSKSALNGSDDGLEQTNSGSDVAMVDAREESRDSPQLWGDSGSDSDYLDEEAKKAEEEAKVAQLIKEAEEKAARPTQDTLKRASHMMRTTGGKDSTTQLMQTTETSLQLIEEETRQLESLRPGTSARNDASATEGATPDPQTAEDRLSLTVSKNDFARMRIIGQFNLGFIIAIRPAHQLAEPEKTSTLQDEVFIIDQHASDEKYNFERLQATTTVQNQRLVQPKLLDLTAVEEEIIIENQDALVKNGFLIEVDEGGDSPVGQRCSVVSLPMSREVTFSTRDLEELLVLLAESPSTRNPDNGDTTFHADVPRPSKVRKMFAMRACRSSVMIGKTLNIKQMERLVTNMGQIDKPWNCPHGRPTMRHLASLAKLENWKEEDGVVGMEEEGGAKRVVWSEWLARHGANDPEDFACLEDCDDEEDNEDEEESC